MTRHCRLQRNTAGEPDEVSLRFETDSSIGRYRQMGCREASLVDMSFVDSEMAFLHCYTRDASCYSHKANGWSIIVLKYAHSACSTCQQIGDAIHEASD